MEPVRRFERAAFVEERWGWRPGEHVTILAPTGWGKTYLAFDLLKPLSTPESPTIVLCMKRRDSTAESFGKSMQFRRIEDWPPPPHLKMWEPRKPPGFLLWPKVTGDEDDDEFRQEHAFRAAIQGARNRGKGIKVFADELADLKDIGLERTLSSALRQGRSERAAVFGASQRPFSIPSLAYGQATHLFIGNDPDKRSRDRYGEIGGVDKNELIELTSSLHQHEWLYIRRARGTTTTRMCIVGA